MKTLSRKPVAAGHPLSWTDVEEMYAGHEGLAAAVKALAPLTRDEATALVASHQMVAAARSDLLPPTEQECIAARGAAIVRNAVLETSAAGLEPGELRDGVTMLYELIAETENPDPASLSGWLWGPLGPPLRTQRRLRRSSPRKRYAAHAAESGTSWSSDNAAAFEAATTARIEVLAGDGRAELAALSETATVVTEELAALKAHTPPSQTLRPPVASGAAGTGDQTRLAERCATAADTIRSAAVAAMAAARSVYVSNAASMPDRETAALETIRAVGWVDAVLARWLDLAPSLPVPAGYFAVTAPTPGEFWLGAFTVARTQIGFAQQGIAGIAKALINRP